MPVKAITVPHPEGNNKGGLQLHGALENSIGSRHGLRRILWSGGSASKNVVERPSRPTIDVDTNPGRVMTVPAQKIK